MTYFELINAFQLGLPINTLFFIIIGFMTFIGILIFWSINISIARCAKRRARIKFCHYMKILIVPPFMGTILASIPPTLIALIISVTFSRIMQNQSADWAVT